MSDAVISNAEANAIVKRALRGRSNSELEAAAWRGLHVAVEKWDGERAFERWASYVIRQHLANQYRTWRTARHTPGVIDDIAGSVASACEQPDPGLKAEISRALDALPPRQAEAAVLCLWDGMTHAEAAAELGVTPQAATQLVHRARVRLQRSLRTTYKEINR